VIAVSPRADSALTRAPLWTRCLMVIWLFKRAARLTSAPCSHKRHRTTST
jgi:hypothetical protein